MAGSNGSTFGTGATNTPSIVVGDGATAITLLAANPARIGFSIQNVGTTVASVRLGAGASATVYHLAVKGGSADNDGLGGSFTDMTGTVYTGIITFFGASSCKMIAYEAST